MCQGSLVNAAIRLKVARSSVDSRGVNEQKMRARVSAVLPRGETYVAAVQLHAGLIVALGSMTLRIPLKARVLAVTDQNVHLYAASWFRVCKPQQLIATLGPGAISEPFRHRLQWETTLEIDGETHWANFAFRNDLERVVEAGRAAARCVDR